MSPEQHLDVDALADVLAGEASLGAEEHVAGCAQCRTTLDELRAAQAQVTEQLAALPAVALPDDIAARLHDALRSSADATAATTVTPFPTAADRTSERANPTRWLAAAAAVVLLLGGGIYGITQLGGDSGGGNAAGTSAGGGSAPELAVARNSSGNDYTDRASFAAAVPDLLAGRSSVSRDTAMAKGAEPNPSASAQAGANTLAAPDPLAPLRDNKGLAECLLALLPPEDASVQPLALDYATFRGQPAMVVVLPSSLENKLDVFVVGPGCSRANDSVLFYTSVDKP